MPVACATPTLAVDDGELTGDPLAAVAPAVAVLVIEPLSTSAWVVV